MKRNLIPNCWNMSVGLWETLRQTLILNIWDFYIIYYMSNYKSNCPRVKDSFHLHRNLIWILPKPVMIYQKMIICNFLCKAILLSFRPNKSNGYTACVWVKKNRFKEELRLKKKKLISCIMFSVTIPDLPGAALNFGTWQSAIYGFAHAQV